MPIPLECPYCETVSQVPEDSLGAEVTCNSCNLLIPTGKQPAQPEGLPAAATDGAPDDVATGKYQPILEGLSSQSGIAGSLVRVVPVGASRQLHGSPVLRSKVTQRIAALSKWMRGRVEGIYCAVPQYMDDRERADVIGRFAPALAPDDAALCVVANTARGLGQPDTMVAVAVTSTAVYVWQREDEEMPLKIFPIESLGSIDQLIVKRRVKLRITFYPGDPSFDVDVTSLGAGNATALALYLRELTLMLEPEGAAVLVLPKRRTLFLRRIKKPKVPAICCGCLSDRVMTKPDWRYPREGYGGAGLIIEERIARRGEMKLGAGALGGTMEGGLRTFLTIALGGPIGLFLFGNPLQENQMKRQKELEEADIRENGRRCEALDFLNVCDTCRLRHKKGEGIPGKSQREKAQIARLVGMDADRTYYLFENGKFAEHWVRNAPRSLLARMFKNS